ncbi:MAG TPA: FtsQ-type POTRA domain-containing protein [Verrucomicrobiae bacterium]|nr:FtsQ-type POTRA domain-containing protein [Verrucomicrobiae bacterium]
MKWFNRKPKNRRLERASVLDVKLRSSQVRAARTRMLGVLMALLFGAVAAVCLFWYGGHWALNALFYENSAFAIEDLDVQTDGVIAVDQLRRWTGVRPGENLLALDTAKLQRDLKMVSLIQSVSVERIPPHTLRVRVAEREPIAQVNVLRPGEGGRVATATFQLDPDGYVIVPLDPRQRSTRANATVEQLPLITGINPNEIQAGRRIDLPQVRAALELILAFERSPMEGLADVHSIDVSQPEALVVSTGQGSQITFGWHDLDQQLRRWRAVFDYGQQNSRAIASMDLAITSSIPVVFQDAGAVQLPTPKATKRTKRKHV